MIRPAVLRAPVFTFSLSRMKVMQHLAQQRFRLLGDFGDEELLDRHAVVLPHPKLPANLTFRPRL